VWLPANRFAQLFANTGVRLVVLNCCLAGTAAPGRSLSGVGPALIQNGVQAVVAMRYEVADPVAVFFSRLFYRHLLTGKSAGRIDLSIMEARRSLLVNAQEYGPRAFVTPTFHSVPGLPPLFSVDRLSSALPRSRLSTTVGIGAKATTMGGIRPRNRHGLTLDPEMLDSLRKRQCVPVVGFGIVAPPAVRSAAAPLPLRSLVEELAQESQFPVSIDTSGPRYDWLVELNLQRVAQHFESQQKRFKLLDAVQQRYRSARPTAAHEAIARLPAPGYFYLCFDGLMEEALNRTVAVLNGIDSALPTDSAAPLLVNVRGAVTAPKTLVLTERDHDELADRLTRPSAAVTNLAKGRLGQSLLFVGVDPRDPTARAFARRLRDVEVQGPWYFVTADYSGVDEAYWAQLKVTMIRAEPGMLIEALVDELGLS
jgi:hypothetical protein